jgi:uncharacterized phage-like protein YoqJ
MKLGITGHRPPGLFGGWIAPSPNKIYDSIYLKIKALAPELVISGMAQGTDTYAAEVAIALGISLEVAVPCDKQEQLWPEPAQIKYKEIISKASKVTVVSPGPYTKECMHIRDRYIVDNSDMLLAVWNGQKFGGTFATIRYAEKQIYKGRKYTIEVIAP